MISPGPHLVTVFQQAVVERGTSEVGRGVRNDAHTSCLYHQHQRLAGCRAAAAGLVEYGDEVVKGGPR